MPETPPLPKFSPLHHIHVEAGASFTDFAGWQMPVRYTSDLAEHHAVRTGAGIFDLSHMAEILVVWPGGPGVPRLRAGRHAVRASRTGRRSTACSSPKPAGSSTTSSSTGWASSPSSWSPTPATDSRPSTALAERAARIRRHRHRQQRRLRADRRAGADVARDPRGHARASPGPASRWPNSSTTAAPTRSSRVCRCWWRAPGTPVRTASSCTSRRMLRSGSGAPSPRPAATASSPQGSPAGTP